MSTRKSKPIESALVTVTDEIEKVTAEKCAFEEFRARLEQIESTRKGTSATGDDAVPALAVNTPSTADTLQQVRNAYAETVMDVPHYESDYADTLTESLAAEFGRDLAESVVTDSQVTPLLQQTLDTASRQARRERIRFLRILEDERESLRRTGDRLDTYAQKAKQLEARIETASRTATLADVDDELRTLHGRCERLLVERQEKIQGRPLKRLSSVDEESLSHYLYGNQENTCPALAELTHFLQGIRDLCVQCLKE